MGAKALMFERASGKQLGARSMTRPKQSAPLQTTRRRCISCKPGSPSRSAATTAAGAPLLRRAGAVFGKALLGWEKAQAEIAGLLDDNVPATNRKLIGLTRAIWSV